MTTHAYDTHDREVTRGTTIHHLDGTAATYLQPGPNVAGVAYIEVDAGWIADGLPVATVIPAEEYGLTVRADPAPPATHDPATLGAFITTALGAVGLPTNDVYVTLSLSQYGITIGVQVRRVTREQAESLADALGLSQRSWWTVDDKDGRPVDHWLHGRASDGFTVEILHAGPLPVAVTP